MIVKTMFLGVITLTTLILSACNSLSMQKYDGVYAGQYFMLKEPLSIAANTARTYIQHGQAKGSAGFDHSEQHCRLEVKNISEAKQTIVVDAFRIVSIQIDEEMIAYKESSNLLLAFNTHRNIQNDISPLNNSITLVNSDYERVETMDLIHFNLSSEKQPNVMRLTCAGSLSNGNPSDAPRSYRPDFKQIKKILGNVGYIK